MLVKILVTAGAAAGGAALLLYSSLGQAEYYHHVDELMESPESWEGQNLRVNGIVEPGSIEEEIVDHTLQREFVLEHEGERLRVQHEGPAPDTFRDLSDAVAMGELVEVDGEYVLMAHDLTAQCPSKYEGEPPVDDLDTGELSPPDMDSSLDSDGSAGGY